MTRDSRRGVTLHKLTDIRPARTAPPTRRLIPRLCATLLLGVLSSCLAGGRARAQTNGSVPVFRHHVIFLLDSSGSLLQRPRTLEEYHSLIRTRLPALLGDAGGNGFGVNLYDPRHDLSSAFAFGLSPQRPFFAPSLTGGFMQRLWFQEPGRDYDDLVTVAPAPNMRWTAINSAFFQAVRKARWEAEQSGTLGRAFERTFLVVVSDGQSNTSTDSLDEIGEIRGAALGAGVSDSDLRPDYDEAAAYNNRLTEFFALRTTSTEDAGGADFKIGNFKIFIRELHPHKLVNLGDLLDKNPDQETQLELQPHSIYAGTLSLSPRAALAEQSVSYQLVGVQYRLPGQSEYQTAADVPTHDRPLTLGVNVDGEDVDQARADFKLSFVRHDPVYGQAVQVFEESVHFRRQPRKYILGAIPITDALVTLHGGLSQDHIAALDSVLLFAAFLFLLYVLLFPAPRAEMELTGAAAGPDSPLPVPLGRFGEQGGPMSVLGSVRFRNTSFRKLPFVGRALRFAERRFDVRLAVERQLPPEVRTNGKPVVGIDVAMSAERLLRRQTEGSQATILLSTDAFTDYTGEAPPHAECGFIVRATQTGRRFGLWPFSRELEPRTQSFHLRFEPEEPDVRAALRPLVESFPTGETGSRPYPNDEAVAGWLTLPHYVGREDDPDAIPEFDVQISNEAGHVCAKTASVKLTVVLSPAARRGRSVEVSLDAPHEEVLRVEAHAAKPLSVPVRLPYEALPLPLGVEGEDYILSATVTAADGQQWAPQTVRYGLRIGPDPRRTAPAFRVATPREESAREWRWRSFGSPADGATLKASVAPQVNWNIGQQKESYVFTWVEFDNVARNGEGTLLVRLKPGATVSPHPDSEPGLEPVYTGRREQLVRLLCGSDDGATQPSVYSLGEAAEWRIDNEAKARPVRLRLEFQPHAIERMERRPPHYRYVCELPFECFWREAAAGPERRVSFNVNVDFEVVRYSGEHALAIDFGTSAVVIAFEQDEHNIRSRPNGVSSATLHLQGRYRELLKEWKASTDAELQLESELEPQEPNPEHSTEFIPSRLLMRQNKQVGETDFVILPVSHLNMSKRWDRTVYYLKGLILRGDKNLPYHVVENVDPLSWKDLGGVERSAPQDGIPVDEIIRSSYRNLLANYVEPLLKKQNKSEYLDRLVVSHPNNFTLGHIFRVRKILAETFPQFSHIRLLSESNAVAVYCARDATRFFRKPPRGEGHRHLLVYDIGAGTVDLTYTRLEWGLSDGVPQLKEMRVLFKSGLTVAGNRLDACLAVLIDEKLNSFVGPLREKGVELKYENHIVNPNGFNRSQYPMRMLLLKKSIQQLKAELSDGERTHFHVRINSSGNTFNTIATVNKVNKDDDDAVVPAMLREFNITRGGDNNWIGIPLSRDEIFEHPEVRLWLDQVTDELIRNLGGALKALGVKPEIDTLILSGRTAQFPPLRERLSRAIRRELGIAQDSYLTPELEPNEKKEAVALGSLLYTLFHGRELRLIDRNVWAKYGVIYNDGLRPRFKEFFGYATEKQPGDVELEVNEMKTVLFRRTLEIARADGPLIIAATFSRDPDADLLDTNAYLDRFQIIHTIGAGYLGPAGRLKVRMCNNEDDTITIDINPGGVQTSVTVKGYREDEHIAQMDWPYQPLKRSRLAGAQRLAARPA